jgi:hypothetical protein
MAGESGTGGVTAVIAPAEPNLARLTPKQRRTLARLDRAPWRWLVNDEGWFRFFDRYEKEADERERAEQERQAQERVDSQRAYFATISRVTTYTGPDYRIRFEGQNTWVRAVKWQYDLAAECNASRAIWGDAA